MDPRAEPFVEDERAERYNHGTRYQVPYLCCSLCVTWYLVPYPGTLGTYHYTFGSIMIR